MYFPEKLQKVSDYDKKWFNSELRSLHRKKQREFFENRKSAKWLAMNKKFRRLKRKAVRNFYRKATYNLKKSDPRKFYSIVKKIGCSNFTKSPEIEELKDLNNFQAAEKIATFFAEISNQYDPVDFSKLPAYLPSNHPPQVTEMDIYQKLRKIKNTQSTHPLDLPNKLREEYIYFLVQPLKDIINTCFLEQTFPAQWKVEYVTPIEKVPDPTSISQMRKIANTSDFSKMFESILKDFILKDAEKNFDLSQYGGRKGVGTEHMIVCYVDRILKLLDSTRQTSAVISAAADWVSAFDRIDPTSLSLKLLKMGIRESIIPILISYISDRKMIVKYKGAQSDPKP